MRSLLTCLAISAVLLGTPVALAEDPGKGKVQVGNDLLSLPGITRDRVAASDTLMTWQLFQTPTTSCVMASVDATERVFVDWECVELGLNMDSDQGRAMALLMKAIRAGK